MQINTQLNLDWSLALPAPHSHKGENGKVLIIGGSELFHSASRWSLDIASRLADMVFYASTPSNNDLIKQIKSQFWNGIVITQESIPDYIAEADSILIGPGMTRSPETAELCNRLLAAHPSKKWIIDAGALQMADTFLFTDTMLLTPHHQEFKRLENLSLLSYILLKGPTDELWHNQRLLASIAGGNAGLTKGGTGDCLAGLIAGLAARSSLDLPTAATLGSIALKTAGDDLATQVGPFYNATDLVEQLPYSLWSLANPDSKNPSALSSANS